MKTNFILLLFGLTISCTKKIDNPRDYSYHEPHNLGDGVFVNNILAYNLNQGKLETLSKDLIDEKLYNVHSVLIYKNHALFYEIYLCGKDKKHGRDLGLVTHDAFKLHDVRSISKSVVSACIGVAIRKGLIKSVNDPIGLYLPEIDAENDKSKITIKNLLTMTSGLLWKEIGEYNNLLNDEAKMDLSFSPIKFILNKELVSEPGSTWNYSAGNTQLLAQIVEIASGQNINQFAKDNIFSPLKITNHEWVSLTGKKIPAAASGLRLSSRSLLKFGILYCDSGKFNGNQIIESSWINSSISSSITRPSLTNLNLKDGGYGFQFWTYDYSYGNRNLKMVEAKGNGGQSVFICQELNLVVVITAGNYGQVKYNDIPHNILNNYILPSML